MTRKRPGRLTPLAEAFTVLIVEGTASGYTPMLTGARFLGGRLEPGSNTRRRGNPRTPGGTGYSRRMRRFLSKREGNGNQLPKPRGSSGMR